MKIATPFVLRGVTSTVGQLPVVILVVMQHSCRLGDPPLRAPEGGSRSPELTAEACYTASEPFLADKFLGHVS